MVTRRVVLRVLGAGCVAVIFSVFAAKVLKGVPLWGAVLIGILAAAAFSFFLPRKKI